ncbi:glycerophosphodiester phosphodiesterase [Saccharopolyspora sp. HNM0983]|uniref:glycerophosphodiester phosphodiesterase n=1 Tax=Saccharopolyspora montiporae TaxID=2781240 RepID=A0A929BB19_9PSEU|nr:glycerophosphodiester phosphodiesterase [Saccharopolyspora sp. HNM0983]MBE9374741.1 glycerophosphodiester phosphodiesterase [Saccharopolyspora sp. HNM0983]
MSMKLRLLAALTAGSAVLGPVPVTAAAAEPEVYGHRGASGYLPEHTLPAYELAARMGADYIEPDLVPTRDGQLVVRHENEIGSTTDVAERPEFGERRTTKTVDGEPVTGWFTEDFTLAELRSLRATERIPELRPDNAAHDGRYPVPTLQDVLDLRERLSAELGREIGVAPETKHPGYFAAAGVPVEPELVRALNRNGLNHPDAKVVVQSFETANLKRLDEQLAVPLLQLIDSSGAPQDLIDAGDPRTYADLVRPEGLREIARYADLLGPDTEVVLPRDEQDRLTGPTPVVRDAHAAGLQVVPYTVRAENDFLPAEFRSSADPAARGDALGFFEVLFAQGVDGIFSDQPDLAVAAREDARTER